MFNDIYSVDAPQGLKFAVKNNVLGTEIMIPMCVKGRTEWHTYLLYEMSDEFRALVLELNEINERLTK